MTLVKVYDATLNAAVVAGVLSDEGYECRTAGDSRAALDEVDRHAPDIIVLDLNLPGLDAYGVL